MDEATKARDPKNPSQPSDPTGSDNSPKPRRRGRGSELLAGILDEVQNDAAREESRLQSSLAKKREDARALAEQEAETRRRKSAESLAAEAERQRRAEATRTEVFRTLVTPEVQVEEPVGPQISGDYAKAVAPRTAEMSADHRKVPKKQKIVPIVLIALVFVVVVAAGGVLAITLTAPKMDIQQYPKVAVSFVTVNPPSTQLTFAMIPEPEPVLPDPLLDTAAQTETAQNTRDRDRNRDRDRDRDRDQEPTNSSSNQTLDIDLDGSSVFDRGSE